MDSRDLMTYLAGKKCAGRQEKPVYFQDGDFVTFFYADDMAHEERIDELVTIYRSFKTNEMVGCKIKGVKSILAKLGSFGIDIEDSKVKLRMLFIGAALVSPVTASHHASELLSRRYGALSVDNLPHKLVA